MRDVISSDRLSALVKKGDKWQHALLLLVEMILNDLLPKVLSYNSAISTCIPSGQRQHALGLLWKKRNNGSFPDVSLSVLLSTFVKRARMEACIGTAR